MKHGTRRWTLAILTTLTLATGGLAAAPATAAPTDTIGPAAAYHILNLNSNQCVGVPGGNHDAGSNLIQWPCGPWADHFWDLVYVGDGWYRLVNVNSRQCMAVPGGSWDPGTTVIQWPCGPWLDHFWRLEATGGGWYHIINRNSNQCLAVPGGSTFNGERLIQWPCGTWRDHYWRFY